MLFLAVFSLLVFSVAAGSQQFSFSPPVGSGGGSPYVITGMGRITAVKVWDSYSGHIQGIQVRYGFVWSSVGGYGWGDPNVMELYEDEFIVQISGKYTYYIQSIVITTNRGRSLHAGQPAGQTFNMYTENEFAELVFLNGRYTGGLTSLGAHWAVLDPATISFSRQNNTALN